ncbi:hypothetical protein [Paraburkholderia lycopersici]|uniref:Uncharacterized protein n=1 Tax=Paraburkholderia lycopersici TaxID=416944 RepID=A0A1G6PK73_9BURK|nr:hypothetical protein [Paraburkholderia lycopersici]SDC79797.1 hypothetical protein SAMN05421548_110156 [Paraburkholderia lycopersici]
MTTICRDMSVETAAEKACVALRDPTSAARAFAGVLTNARVEKDV